MKTVMTTLEMSGKVDDFLVESVFWESLGSPQMETKWSHFIRIVYLEKIFEIVPKIATEWIKEPFYDTENDIS